MTDKESPATARRILVARGLASSACAGALVKLKSGSPMGIICDFADDGRAHVAWMNDEFSRSTLPAACLTMVGKLDVAGGAPSENRREIRQDLTGSFLPD